MRLRSLLFVPGDRPDRFSKAASSGADALILDLEDSVVPERKAEARAAIADFLAQDRALPCLVRVNPLDGDATADDLKAILPHRPDAIMLPKAEGAASIETLAALMGNAAIPVLPIASETPAAIFQLGTLGTVANKLLGVTWGAEDLPASVGAVTAREEDGRYTPPYEVVRSLTLFAAHAAGVAAIETVFPNVADSAGLEAYVRRGRRDGFTGMMAIHPTQVPIINAGMTPSEEEIARAQAIINAFADNPSVGAMKLDGKMIDRPHLKQAHRIMAQANG
jgi:citrate lyase subunit beta/citryl-CoA lyase